MDDINVILIIAIIIIMILLIVMLAKTNLRSICEKSDDFNVCDCGSVCVKPDKDFCNYFPEFSPYCDKHPQPLDIDCPSICETMVAPDARICYTAGALDSKDPSGKYTGPYEDCNKSIIQFCEKKKCKSFNPKKPEYICPAQCYEKTPQGVYPSICFSQKDPDVCSMILPDGTWPTDGHFDQCNTQNIAELCKPEYGCAPYVDADGKTQQFSCAQIPPDMCQDTKCDPVNGICNSADGACTCNPGWSGVNCTEPDGPDPSPVTDCVGGTTWSTSGQSPCTPCSVCQSTQITDQQCTRLTDTTCKDGPAPTTCPDNCTKTNANGKTVEQCFNGIPNNLCSMDCTYSDGIFKCPSFIPDTSVANCNNGIQDNDCKGCDWAKCP